MELAIPHTNGVPDKCLMYADNLTEILLNGSVNNTARPTKPCSHGWEYSRTEIPYATIATEVYTSQLISLKLFD